MERDSQGGTHVHGIDDGSNGPRLMRIIGASATHVGQVRDANQDRALLSGSLGAVADGMGGHLGGEHAASLAIAELSGVRGPISETRLMEVVRAANARIYEGASTAQYRGMGTTVVAAVFDHDSQVMSIVNVGDSRGYLFRDGELKQITVDHSLVEDMLRQGRLSEEEARVHPQRNIVTRALGIGHEVEVDAFAVQMQPSDRIILASDGLFNEIEDEGIAAILSRLASPADAADELVNTAVERGGRDNVTVVLLDVADGEDHEQTATRDAAGAVGASGSDSSESSPDPSSADESSDGEDDYPEDLSARPRPGKRRFRLRSAMLALGVLGVMLFAFVGTAFYARSGYFADEADGAIVIYRGRPGGVLWFTPSQEEVTKLQVTDLDGASLERLERRPVWSSLDDAREFVANFEEIATAADAEADDGQPAATSGG